MLYMLFMLLPDHCVLNSLFIAFYCVSIWSTCGAWFAHVFTYIYIHIWQQYYLDYFSTLNRILSMCLHANELLSSLFCWGLNDRYYMYLYTTGWTSYLSIYILEFISSYLENICSWVSNQHESERLYHMLLMMLSYIILDHHFSASALLYFGKTSHFLLYLSTSWCMAPPYSRNLAQSQMNGPCGVLGAYLLVFQFGSGEGAFHIQVYSLITTWFLALREFGFRAKFPEFSNLFYL